MAKPKKPLHHKVARGLKLALVPHRHNDYRPHLVRRYGLAAILILVILIQACHFAFFDGQILGDRALITDRQLLTETNAARAKNSLAPLAMNQELNQAAQAKASNMLAVGYWSHNAPDGTTPWAFVENAGYKYIDAGENLARGFNTTDAIMTAWMESPSHRANVLGQDYTEVGFAAVNGRLDGRQTTLVVAMYARPIGVPSTGEVTTRTNASPTESTNIWTRLRRGVQSLTPSLLITLIILGITTCVAVLAHVYRRYLPKALRNSWRRHHALYKIAFLVIVAASAVLSYGGGMI